MMQSDRRIDQVSRYYSYPEEERHWDEMSGKELDPDLIKAARAEEMHEFRKHKVYDKVPVQEAIRVTGKKPIGVRWVEVNKGDDLHPEYRSRLVAKEFNKSVNIDMFAATPPWEANKLLLSMAVTRGIGYKQSRRSGLKLDFIDVRRAYFHAKSRRPVYVDLPAEDQSPGKCGRLNKSMYGTRDAAQNWEFEYAEFLIDSGFQQGRAVVCLFYHAERNIRVVVHGDDFTVLGEASQLDWFRSTISERFEVKFRGRLGPNINDTTSVRHLNRINEWTPEGIRIEADQRHAEIIIDQLGLAESAKIVVTPGETVKVKEEMEEETLESDDSTLYRACVARANFLSQDRSDIQYATKELSRKMSNPNHQDMIRLKRLGRYLKGRPRSVIKYDYQNMDESGQLVVKAYTDTDFAGCQRAKKSTSGGVIMMGSHTIKTWSSTQAVIALSSGEAEYYGMVKGASQALGLKSMLGDIGMRTAIKVHIKTDASAAIGIASRRGMGKVRHIETNQLWLQEKVT